MIPKLPKGYTHPMAIGEGAFSSVFRARQTSLDRWVALKILKEKDEERRTGQLKEARLQAELHLRCVPEVFDVSEWKNRVLIVMQWVHGIPLSQADSSKLSESQKTGLAEAILISIAEMHRSGYTHGDLKPDNILLSPDDGVYLIDFGFSRPSSIENTPSSGIIRGTPAYMAPELKFGRGKIDHYRAELYSLGKLLAPLLATTSASDFPNALLHEDPERRPESAEKVLELWTSQYPGQTIPDWKAISASKSAEYLANKLFKSARQLLQSKRLDEAYWLITECLENNPNHSEGLAVMESFPELQQQIKKKTSKKITLAAIAILLIAIGFVTGVWRTYQKQKIVPMQNERKPLLSPENKSMGKQKRALLKPFPATKKGFNASIQIPQLPESGILIIDGTPLAPEQYGSQYPVSQGKHHIVWKRRTDTVKWSATLNLLPFQTQSFSVPEQYLK